MSYEDDCTDYHADDYGNDVNARYADYTCDPNGSSPPGKWFVLVVYGIMLAGAALLALFG